MRRRERTRGFTLVELLVVVGIIGLLIGILLPSLGGARKSAKTARIKAQFQSLQQALEMFHNDVEEYPDSSKRQDPTEDANLIGGFSGAEAAPAGYSPTDAVLYGAQWMMRGLMGKDLRGYVVPSKARKKDVDNPARWYDFKPSAGNFFEGEGPRETLYLSGEKLTLARVAEITTGPKPLAVSTAPEQYQSHVLLDAFERPILYYRAEPRGRQKVLCDSASGDVANQPIPYYRLSDNEIFTGNNDATVPGWKFATEIHPLEYLGDPDQPDNVAPPLPVSMPFAKYVHDHRVGIETVQGSGPGSTTHGRVQPYNHETYMLISAGADGLYGTEDDVKNFGER